MRSRGPQRRTRVAPSYTLANARRNCCTGSSRVRYDTTEPRPFFSPTALRAPAPRRSNQTARKLRAKFQFSSYLPREFLSRLWSARQLFSLTIRGDGSWWTLRGKLRIFILRSKNVYPRRGGRWLLQFFVLLPEKRVSYSVSRERLKSHNFCPPINHWFIINWSRSIVLRWIIKMCTIREIVLTPIRINLFYSAAINLRRRKNIEWRPGTPAYRKFEIDISPESHDENRLAIGDSARFFICRRLALTKPINKFELAVEKDLYRWMCTYIECRVIYVV